MAGAPSKYPHLGKVKSVVGGSLLLEEERISLESGVSRQLSKDGLHVLKNTIEYHLRLRTLCYAMVPQFQAEVLGWHGQACHALAMQILLCTIFPLVVVAPWHGCSLMTS